MRATARASPITSWAVVDEVGARLLGQASWSMVASSTMSACEARNDSVLPTRAIRVFPKSLISGTSIFISGVSPLFETQMTTSSGCTMPRSPWMASAACIKAAGVPVELNVETILVAMFALFPMPVTTTLPFAEKIVSTAFTKASSMCCTRCATAFFSSSIT